MKQTNRSTVSHFLIYSTLTACVICIASVIYVSQQQDTIHKRIDTNTEMIQRLDSNFNGDSLDIFKQHFQEDGYLRQLDNSFSFLLWFVAILAAFIGFVSLKQFDQRVEFVMSFFTRFKQKYKDKAASQKNEYMVLQHDILDNMVEIFNGLGNLYWEAGAAGFNEKNQKTGFNNCLIALNAGYKWHKCSTEVKDMIAAITSLGYVLERLLFEMKAIGDSEAVVAKLEELNVMPLYRDEEFKKVFIKIRQQVNNVRVNENCEAVYRLLGFGEIPTVDTKEK